MSKDAASATLIELRIHVLPVGPAPSAAATVGMISERSRIGDQSGERAEGRDEKRPAGTVRRARDRPGRRSPRGRRSPLGLFMRLNCSDSPSLLNRQNCGYHRPVALGTGYAQQNCHLARALEVVGERWTMLVLRDCFYGVRRFSDLLMHLDISRAVLTDRLNNLVDAGLLERHSAGRSSGIRPHRGRNRHVAKPVRPVPMGERYASHGRQPVRIFTHALCETDVDDFGRVPALPPDARSGRSGGEPRARRRRAAAIGQRQHPAARTAPASGPALLVTHP